MPDREKLIELIRDAKFDVDLICVERDWCDGCPAAYGEGDCKEAYIADHLIAHGVTVQELDGCEYCKEDNEGFRRMFGAFSLVNPFHGKTWQIHAGKCKPREINFCPMCGRRLPQPPKGE